MWIAEYVDDITRSGEIVRKYLRGPVCIIGRKAECDILFLDKTVSRQHLQVLVPSSPSTSLTIRDLNSKFLTHLRDTRLPPEVDVNIVSGDVIRLGAGATEIRFTRCSFLFTSTRLEANDKERLKMCCESIGASYTDGGQHWTHLFANKVSATVKILSAIVLRRPIVTVDWVASFADPSLSTKAAAVTIPPPSRSVQMLIYLK